MDEHILGQLFDEDETFTTTARHRIVEIDDYVSPPGHRRTVTITIHYCAFADLEDRIQMNEDSLKDRKDRNLARSRKI